MTFANQTDRPMLPAKEHRPYSSTTDEPTFHSMTIGPDTVALTIPV